MDPNLKRIIKKDNREQSLLQTSISLSYLLHNSMSKELFGKVLKCKNKINKKEEENFEQEKLE